METNQIFKRNCDYCSKFNVNKFYEKISFTIKRKQNKLEDFVGSIKSK